MNNVFVMVDRGEPTIMDKAKSFFGSPPRYGFSIKTDSLMSLVLELPDQINSPVPTRKPLHFGLNGEYYQTWSEQANFRERLISLGLHQLPTDSAESLAFLKEWTQNLQQWIQENRRFMEAGANSLRGF